MAIVYALTFAPTGEAYIGVTSNLAKRFREHRCLLRAKKHHAIKLQKLWDDAWNDASQFVMVELQDADYAHRGAACVTEQDWITLYDSLGLLLNTNKTSQGLGGEASRKGIEAARIANTGRVHSPESREKRRLAQLGKPKGHGAKISATKKALGQKPSLEAASLGGIAACAKRWNKTGDDVV